MGNQFIVKSTPTGTAVKLDGSNVADTFAVGNSQDSLAAIRQLQINGKGGHDVLNFVDTASPAYKPIAQDPSTYALASSSLTRSQWVRLTLNQPVLRSRIDTRSTALKR